MLLDKKNAFIPTDGELRRDDAHPTPLTDRAQELLLKVTGEHRAGIRGHMLFAQALDTGLRNHELIVLDLGAEHRYHVHLPERILVVVIRGSSEPGTRYLHVDPLGSVDVLTDERGAVVDWRSHDPFVTNSA